MNNRVHFDLDTIERQIREQMADIARQGRAGAGCDKALVEAQIAFHEAHIQFSLTTMRLRNQGVPRRTIDDASALSLHATLRQTMDNAVNPDRVLALVFGGSGGETLSVEKSFTGTTGGRA